MGEAVGVVSWPVGEAVGLGRRVVVISGSIGAGHDGAAGEIARRFERAGYDVSRHDFLDLIPGRVGSWLKSAYRLQLLGAPRTWGWVLAAFGRPSWLATLATCLAAMAGRNTLRAIGLDADAVVSTYPLASQVLGRLRLGGRLQAPVATFLTDMSVHPLWVAAGVDTHWALHAVAAAEAEGLGADSVDVVGPAVSPAFRSARSARERRHARSVFGLPATAPLALVVAGSWGVGDVISAARDIASTGVAIPVLLCGLNHGLRRRWETEESGLALPWVSDMPTLLLAFDVVVQNAGGLTSLESRAAGLPVVTYRCLPGHGATNAAALNRAGWAEWVHSPDQLAASLKEALCMEQVSA